ncbi:MAG: LEA type 2 family protein [Desulfuromonadales bacterium]
MNKLVKIMLCLGAVFYLGGCATVLDPGFESPTVGIRSFRVIPSPSLAPQFEIGLHIVNPNRTPLKLEGIVYTIKLEGQRVLMGVANDLPEIGSYGEGDVTLNASADLLSSINLFASLMQQPQDTFSYELEATLDIGRFRPRLQVQEKGEISLQAPAQ